MKIINKSLIILFVLLFTLINSCSSPEEAKYIPPNLSNFPESGLLGQVIVIPVENVQIGKLKVFFDIEEAAVKYISDKEIEVIVPRTIKKYNPTLKVIDLNENKTILEKTFLLKKPVISRYSVDNVTFNETFTIYGDNFDILKEYVSVLVNNETASIINVDYNKIELQIPNKIKTSELEIKVTSQLQEVTAPIVLHLKNPTISGIQKNSVWIGTLLDVDGLNFNPNQDFGEVFVNGVQCRFQATNNKLSIEIPPGPYKDFKITNITYKMAGLTYSFDCSLNIMNDGILVDYMKDAHFQRSAFVYNNKAYQFKYNDNGSYNFNFTYSLLEFSPITEKWTELLSFRYTGYLANVVFDGKKTVYLYKRSTANDYSLSKLDLSTMMETPILIPFGNKIDNPILFAYQDNFYFISGVANNNGASVVIDQKYQYSANTNSWKVLPASAFSIIPDLGTNGCSDSKYLFIGNDIYITLFTGIYKTYKIDSNLDVTEYRLYDAFFEYANEVFGIRSTFYQELYNINTNASKQLDFASLFSYGPSFFTINNEIYYNKGSWAYYYPNSMTTNKLRKEILNGLY